MNHLLSILLLLLTSATAVHSSPTSTTKKYLRRTQEFKPKSNDDPDLIKFNFSLQSSSPPSSAQRVADALESFGTSIFEKEFNARFLLFGVYPLTTTSVAVAASRGSWRQLEQQGQHSSSFEAKLILDKSLDLYADETDAEDVKQLFLNRLNSGAFDLGSLLGEWTAVDYVPVVTDAVEVSEEASTTTTDTTEATQTTGAEVVLPAVVPEVTTNNSKGDNVVPASSVPSTATVGAESAAADNEAGDINNNVLGIFFAVIGVCLVAFLFVAFVQGRKRQRNRAVETSMEHIGDVHLEEEDEDENEKPKVTVGMWAAGLLPGKGKSNDNNNGAFPTAAAAPVEVTEIDKVLADLNDSDDSSFVSAIGSDAEDTSVYSGYSGMTGISDLNYQPKNKETDESKLEKVEEMKPAISYLDHSKVSLMRDTSLSTGTQSMRKKESFESDPSDSKGSGSGTSQSMRKEESFESDYRDKSAMATLNLKKDMLNADVGEDEKARTMSAQQNSDMLQKQRQVDKVRAATVKAKKRMKSVSPPQKGGVKSSSPNRVVKAEPDESRDQLLPSPIRKSDDSNLELV